MARPTSPPYGERILQLKPAPMKGLDVWHLQIKLQAWGSGSDPDGIGRPHQPVRVNGTFDRATSDAVKRLQNALTLPITGIVDDATFTAIDKDAALWPVLVWWLRCPCADGKNVSPVRCRCHGTNPHPSEGVCTGFGNNRFTGQFRLDGVTLPDGTSLDAEKYDIYDKREYPGVDKALLWALRGLMRRANVPRLGISAGYRCWQDNYQHADWRNLRHRTSTFHMGKMVEFYHEGVCAEWGQNPDVTVRCGTCAGIRKIALEKCGFQPRWQMPDIPVASEVGSDGPPPHNLFAVSLSTVQRKDRHQDEFVKTYHESLQPLYPGLAGTFSYPLNLGAAGLDVRTAPSAPLFALSEHTATGAGSYPLGASRLWHTGVHLYAGVGTEVRAMADGEIVGVRAGEATTAKTLGSRNFVLIKHKHQNQTWYSLYMHLDGGAADAASAVPWRKKLHAQTVDHIQIDEASPTFTHAALPAPSRLVAAPGFAKGERVPKAAAAAATDPRTVLDTKAPLNSQVIQIVNAASPADTYVFLQMETHVLAQEVAADAALLAKINNHEIVGLDKPIRVAAGELIGYLGNAPTDAAHSPQGAFLHLEAFSETEILTGEGFTRIDAGTAANTVDRKQVIAKLKAAKLLDGLPDDVLLDGDMTGAHRVAGMLPFRSVVLHGPSAWDMDWKAALAAATPFSFMQDVDRDALGDKMNEYRWWTDVSGGTRLPASSTVYHFHPLTLLLHYAFA